MSLPTNPPDTSETPQTSSPTKRAFIKGVKGVNPFPNRPPLDMRPLTPKQRAFAAHFARTADVARAYKEVYRSRLRVGECRREGMKVLADTRVKAVIGVIHTAMIARGEVPLTEPKPVEPFDPPMPGPDDLPDEPSVAGGKVTNLDIDRTADRYVISRARVAEEFALMGFARMSDFVKLDKAGHPYADLSGAKADQWSAIQEISIVDTVTGEGRTMRRKRTTTIKLADKRLALIQLATMAGWMDGRGIDEEKLAGTPADDAQARQDLRRKALRALDDLAKPSPLTVDGDVPEWDGVEAPGKENA